LSVRVAKMRGMEAVEIVQALWDRMQARDWWRAAYVQRL
jgi:hypothetical protein